VLNRRIRGLKKYITHDAVQKIRPIREQKRGNRSLSSSHFHEYLNCQKKAAALKLSTISLDV